MSKMRYFFLSLNFLNGLLAAAVAAIVFFAVIPFLNPAAVPLPAAKGTAAGSVEKAVAIQSLRPAPADYAVIIEQNLFHPERKVPPEKPQDKVLPKPDLVLYGTLITDNASYAFVEDRKAPYSTAGRGKRQVTLKKGESLGGYVLREIEASRIVLIKGDERLVVSLDDKEKRRVEGPAAPAVAGLATGGTPPPPQALPSPPRAAPPSARAVTLPAPSQQQPPKIAPSAQTGQPSAPAPGIGGSGTWPPTQSSVEQTQQRLREGRLLRMEQLQKQQ
ncbi:MAG: hypothetical protein LLG97_10650 [Deltaproteobacteria bacterium]|nr:hypothetical protein [Deltaproteobacteria bacterium]